MQEFIGQCLSLFDGSHDAFGVFEESPGSIDGVKVLGKTSIENRQITATDWIAHLQGERAIGVAPLNSHGLLRFAVINVDAYDNEHRKIIEDVQRLRLPLAPVRSKSGGLHLYLFLSGLVPAAPVVAKLKDMAAVLGISHHSIIPSQTEVIADRGDMARWVIMPYFNTLKAQTNSFGYKFDSTALGLREFLLSAESLQLSSDTLHKLKVEIPDQLDGAPPCLQYLSERVEHIKASGAPETFLHGGRQLAPAKLVYNFAVYAKKAEPDGWEDMVRVFNAKLVNKLPDEELKKTLEIIAKGDRKYTCAELPIKQHCNKARCHRCTHGVKITPGMPTFGTLTKIESDDVTWFVALEGGKRIELTTEQLQNPKLFQARCMEATSLMPSVPKREEWEAVVQELMADVLVVRLPEDVSAKGILVGYLENFLTARQITEDEKMIVSGRPYIYQDTWACFRMQDFLTYLDQRNFRALKSTKIGLVVRERFGAQNMTARIDGRTYFLWMVPIDKLPLIRPAGNPDESRLQNVKGEFVEPKADLAKELL